MEQKATIGAQLSDNIGPWVYLSGDSFFLNYWGMTVLFPFNHELASFLGEWKNKQTNSRQSEGRRLELEI
jgi:hypothetical protein